MKVLELVVFDLSAGVTRERFLGTVDAVWGWIDQQPGFISRELSHDAEGDRWIEAALMLHGELAIPPVFGKDAAHARTV